MSVNEQLELAISQYLDGLLPQAERVALEARLASDPQARRVLEEYRALDNALKRSAPALPEIRWDALAASIGAAIDEDQAMSEDEDAQALPKRGIMQRSGIARRSRWRIWAPVSLAAALLLAIGLAIAVSLRSGNRTPNGGTVAVATHAETQPVAIAQASGPLPDPPRGPQVAEVTIGPASGADPSIRLAESVINRPTRVVWIVSAAPPAQDTQPALY
jgi:anti-sigma factor RsiW